MAEGNDKAKPETTSQTVTMTDGRKVDFVGKRKMLKESLIGADGSLAVRLDFVNGETRTFPLHANFIPKFATHGAEQKYGDETAGAEDVDDMILAVDDLHERLKDGNVANWTTRREASGIAGTSTLIKALVEVMGKPVEKVKEFLKTRSQAEKMALRVNPKIKPVVDRIEAEKATKGQKVDTESILGELANIA